MVLGFTVFVATNTVRGNLIQDGFYEEALAENNVYQRLYTDLLNDEEFAPQIDKLLGGVNIKREDVEETIKKIAPEDLLEALVEAGIKGLIDYFQGDKLQFKLDITRIVVGIHDIVVGYTVNEVGSTPVKQYATYEEFLEAAKVVVAGLQQGQIPSEVPYHSIPASDRAQAKEILIATGKLDRKNPEHAEAIAQLEAAIDQDRVDVAIKWSALGVLDPLIKTAIQGLTDNPLVHQEQRDDGVHFILSPPDTVTSKLESKLAIAQTAGTAATWARIAGLAALVIGAVLMVVLFRADKVRALRWVGAPLMVAGAIGFVAWLIARKIVTDKVAATIESKKGLPASLRNIMGDVAGTVISDLTPSVWIPSLILVGLGAGAVGASFLMKR